jgi:Transglycosylase SLT domain
MRLLALLFAATMLLAEDIPAWVMAGIAKVETRSYYQGDKIVYVDRRIGAAGERGVFQCTPGAFKEVAKRGESFERLSTDTRFAEEIAVRYLTKLRKGGKRSWRKVLAIYNGGYANPQYAYAEKVRAEGVKATSIG